MFTLPEMPTETLSIDGHPGFLILPKNRGETPTPWVWYAPTLPEFPGEKETWMFERFLNAGIAIGGVDVGESYGNLKGRAIFTQLYHELVGRNLSKKPCVLARSRGGLMHYNWAIDHPTSVACISGIYPVSNLASYPGLQIASAAYGLTERELEIHLSEHNPIDRLAPLVKAQVPIFHIHGDVDKIVPLETNSLEMARRLVSLGGKMELIISQGQGHSYWPGFFQCQELVDFVILHARRD